MNFENIKKLASDIESEDILSKIEMGELDETFLTNKNRSERLKERIEDKIMSQLVCDKMTEILTEELYDLEIDEDIVDEVEKEVKKKMTEERLRILSYPWEIRERLFENNKNLLEKENGPALFVSKLLEIAEENGFSMGYHLTNSDIKKNNNNSWNIEGYEFDDRDEMKMAYYSEDWISRYKGKGIIYKNLYMVRSDKSEDTSHKVDTSNNWGRAVNLSIIAKINLDKISSKTNNKYQSYMESKKNL